MLSILYNIRMKIVVCGVGALDRGDDGFGPYVIEQLGVSDTVVKFDCGLYPENYLNKIIALAPDLVMFFDAVAGGETGPVMLKNEEIAEQSPVSVTTHSLSFGAIYDFLRENGVEHVFFLGLPAISYELFSESNKMIADRLIAVLNNIDTASGLSIISLYEALSEEIR